MNLSLVISSLRCGGAERVLAQLANYWAERGDMVTLITLDSCASDWYELDPRIRRFALGVMTPSEHAASAISKNVLRILSLRRAVAASGASVVLSFEERTSVLVLVATAWMRLRVVVSERNDPRAHGVGRAWTLLRRLAYPFTDALVVQSAVFVPWARAATLGQRQVEVIPNPAPEVPIHRLSEDRSAHTIVAIGRLVPQKGFDVLLTAFARIADEFPSWNLTIAGEGKERSRLCDLAATLGITARVTLAGWIPEPGNLLAKATFFVMSSRYEGFPNALVEAISYGVPVISTSWAGAAEIITDGVDGLLVPVTSPESLAMSMRRLMSDPELRNRLRRNASAVSHRYDIRAVVERWDAVLAPPEGRMPAASEHRPDAGS